MEKTTCYFCPYCKMIFKTNCLKHEKLCKQMNEHYQKIQRLKKMSDKEQKKEMTR